MKLFHKKLIGKHLILYQINSSKNILWLRISKKLKKANKRNLLKRRIREAFKKLNIKAHVLIKIKSTYVPSYKEIYEDLKNITKSLHFF